MINIVIPAAGEGQRFKDAGYKESKPMLDVCGKPMIERVMDNVRPKGEYHFIVIAQKKQHMVANIQLDQPTQGAVDTILKAREYIDDNPLLIANCDQLIDFDVDDFIKKSAPDGSLVTFKSKKPHHSYVSTAGSIIFDIEEKPMEPSGQAVTGVYYFAKGTDFLDAAERVIRANEKVKGEFYTSTVIKEMILRGKKLNTYDAPTAILGTPEELQIFEMAVQVAKTL